MTSLLSAAGSVAPAPGAGVGERGKVLVASIHEIGRQVERSARLEREVVAETKTIAHIVADLIHPLRIAI